MATNTIRRKVLIGVTVSRESFTKLNRRGVEVKKAKPINLKPGDVFDFTQEEVDEIEAGSPGALSAEGSVDLDSGDVKGEKGAGKGKAKTAKTDDSI